MNIIVLHGKRLKSNGEISSDFSSSIQKVKSLLNEKGYDQLIILGGKTRKGFPSEASVAKMSIGEDIPIILEEESKSTYENICNLNDILKNLEKVEKLTIVSSDYHIPRLKFLYKRYLERKGVRIEFVGSPSKGYLFKLIIEYFILLYSMLDTKEEYLTKYLKKFFRAGV